MEQTHFEALYPADTRFVEIEKILNFVKAGNSCQLLGLPGSGRSSILGLLAFNRAIRQKHLGENHKWFHFVPLDFSEIRHRPLTDAMKFIFLGLIDSLRERAMDAECEAVNTIFTDALKTNDEMVLFQGLKRAIDFLTIEKELTVVLLFDRFEEYIPTVTNEFFANLRILRNRAKYRFSVVFSLNRPLDQLVDPMRFADFYEFVAGNEIFVSLFDKPGFDFRLQYSEKVNNKTLKKEDVQTILKLTGGLGKLTKHAIDALFHNDKAITIEEFLLTQQSILGSLYEIWLYLTPAEQHIIAYKEKLASLELGRSGRRENSSENESSFLTKVQLVHDDKIQIPLLKTFIQTHVNNLAIEQFNNAFTYDQQSHEIRKGDQTFSDKLTASEFKLLRFLIENQGRIVEREEIISAIWEDAKSTAGVTDQALDQLIFRLRKKIEEDANNPKYIETIKGRGFKFFA